MPSFDPSSLAFNSPLLLAAQEVTSDTFFRFSRVESMTAWWHWLLLVGACLVVFAVIAVMYYFDSVELPVAVTLVLLGLRVTAFAVLLVYFLGPELRTKRMEVKDSRVIVLADTSQSMSLTDEASNAAPTRIEDVISELSLAGDGIIDKLREKHQVVVYRFDEGEKPVELAVYSKAAPKADDELVVQDAVTAAVGQAMVFGAVSIGLFVASLVSGIIFIVMRRGGGDAASWALLAGVVCLVGSIALFAVANLRGYSAYRAVTTQNEDIAGEETPDEETDPEDVPPEIVWKDELQPRGVESRLGDALAWVVNKERGGPIGGVVILSDGNNNAGLEPAIAVAAAKEADIPVYLVGIGSDKKPINVRVVDLDAPERVYKEDKFTASGLVQGSGLEGRTVTVELVSAPAGADTPQNERFEDERRVRIGPDGRDEGVTFEITPKEDDGKRIYKLRVDPPEGDHDANDNERNAIVEVVKDEAKVLIIAGGPTREYRFLRNQLYRDESVISHVWLQSGLPGQWQESNHPDGPLQDFPTDEETLFDYDCVIAFDPDWELLSEEQLVLLERFVGEQAGGLIVVAGPVFTPQWSNRRRGEPKADIVKGLYPVSFFSRGAVTLRLGRFGGDEAWPLKFTREGTEADFLMLEDTPAASEDAWTEFGGIYGYYAVNEPKPGASIYAHFSDPETAINDELPIYLAGHFYGAGRVFFQASGEMWRVRSVDDAYFEKYYTKLIRWGSQGRLLRDSKHGVLLVDKERALVSDHIQVRAILTDSQHRPLEDESVPYQLFHPNGETEQRVVNRLKDSAREGMYVDQFTVTRSGNYRLVLNPPGGEIQDALRREVRVRVPDREKERSQRNDYLMNEIAERTGGAYFVGINTAMNRLGGGGQPVYQQVEPREQIMPLPSRKDESFSNLILTWMLGLICGVLCLEWLTRRLSRLA